MLSSLVLDCPALECLDATFCGRLGRSALAWVVKSAPPLHTLVLSVCSHLDGAALEALGTLHTLRLLDLSYTEIQARLLVHLDASVQMDVTGIPAEQAHGVDTPLLAVHASPSPLLSGPFSSFWREKRPLCRRRTIK